MRRKSASAVVYIIFFFVLFLAFCAFAVDATIVYNIRGKLQNATEATALAAASEFKYKDSPTAVEIEQKARDIFKTTQTDALKYANINDLKVSTNNKQVLIVTQLYAQTYFLRFLGIGTINLNAQALAVSEELPVTAKYTSINWITASAAYLSDIISKSANFNDTAILLPLGNFPSASYDLSFGIVKYDLIENEDNRPLSLGPGGFITIKLPAPIIDKPGPDLYIKEIGINSNLPSNNELGIQEGYMVFAGLDNDPTNPYVQSDRPGAGLKWVNISCTGTPQISDIDGLLGAYDVDTKGDLNVQTKFYGSGYFDIGASCSNGFKGIAMAKYIRIIDDNDESAMVTNSVGAINPNKYYKAMLYGEASTPTAGADIDAIKVLNHVRLLPPSSYTP